MIEVIINLNQPIEVIMDTSNQFQGDGDLFAADTLNVPNSATQLLINLPSALTTTDYIIQSQWLNAVDASPQFQDIVVIAKTTTSFTLSWNAGVDSANYQIMYTVHKKQI